MPSMLTPISVMPIVLRLSVTTDVSWGVSTGFAARVRIFHTVYVVVFLSLTITLARGASRGPNRPTCSTMEDEAVPMDKIHSTSPPVSLPGLILRAGLEGLPISALFVFFIKRATEAFVSGASKLILAKPSQERRSVI